MNHDFILVNISWNKIHEMTMKGINKIWKKTVGLFIKKIIVY